MLFGGFNPAEVADASALMLTKDGSDAYLAAKAFVYGDEFVDASLPLFEIGTTIQDELSTFNAIGSPGLPGPASAPSYFFDPCD
jgi:hypothetical protein